MEQISVKNKKTRARFGVLALLFINVMINYLDRTNLSVAAASLSKDLDLSPVQMGLIFSAFGWSYAFLQVPGGLLADKIAPRVLYAFCLITWSLSTVFQGAARGFASLFALRMATGVFEAPSYPINNRVVTSWFPNHERASAIAMYVSGQFIGLAFFTPILVMIQVSFGWKGLFLITGLVGLVWGVVWYFLYRDPLDHKNVNQDELKYIEEGGGLISGEKTSADKKASWSWINLKQVLTKRNLWGIYIGQFAVNATLYFFLTWFPTYLVQYRHMDFIKTGYLASIPFLAACAGLLLSGFISDNLVKKGKSVGMARKTPIILGLLISVSIVGANYSNTPAAIIFFMALAFFGAGMALISWVFVSILSPKHLIGLTGGVFNFAGSLAGIVVPIVIGYLAKDGDFEPALLFIGAIGFIGALSYAFLVGKIDQVPVSNEEKLAEITPTKLVPEME
ncbi:MFS transporter [Adhaeribacter aquaticus]|uniref:MFS transporter n=1 Tax=Adhaeribacter aquaticus TaxID=299567 RepID=UPI000424BD7B|nr:MFS transporter [Adhaeribacter aquaticus]